MASQKKLIRQNFRDACYKRDKYKCAKCNFQSTPEQVEKELDAHHITDRNLMPNGGYVKENGISLCAPCHEKAEEFHSTGIAYPGYSVDDLYKVIGSSLEKATEASKKFKV
jgi:5-methylcytosine-specific restriction endonuclease McrA